MPMADEDHVLLGKRIKQRKADRLIKKLEKEKFETEKSEKEKSGRQIGEKAIMNDSSLLDFGSKDKNKGKMLCYI